MRLRAIARDENVGPRELAEIVGKDPVLVGVLTRVAHSPIFYQAGRARSLAEVIARLGGMKTLAIAVSTELRSQFTGVDQKTVDLVWTRSADVAAWALRAARLSRQSRLADLAYLAALTHDVGICVLLLRYPERVNSFRTKAAHEFDLAALDLDTDTGAEHAAVGCIVARNWKLPPVVCDAIRIHHGLPPSLSPDADTALLAILIAVGRRLVDGPTAQWQPWESLAATQLGIDQAMLEKLLDEE